MLSRTLNTTILFLELHIHMLLMIHHIITELLMLVITITGKKTVTITTIYSTIFPQVGSEEIQEAI
jgi:hypothetical protein